MMFHDVEWEERNMFAHEGTHSHSAAESFAAEDMNDL